MTVLKILAAAALLAATAWQLVPAQPVHAADLSIRRHHHHRHHHVRAYPRPYRFTFSYNHNYGPAEFYPDGIYAVPDRVIRPLDERPYAYYDGYRRYCAQSSSSYRGQDGRRHPCN